MSIPLEPDLQEHTYNMAQEYNVHYEVIMAIMWHESRYQVDVPDNYNSNGTVDRGLAQINSCNWEWLNEKYSLDISNPYDNIEAAALILSQYLVKYDIETALACYAAGEYGAVELGSGRKFVKEILEIAKI